MAFLRGLRSRSVSEPRRPAQANPPPLPPSTTTSSSSSSSTTSPSPQQPFYRTLSAPLVAPPPEYPPEDPILPPPRFPIAPRDEEGCEPLPPYSATLVRAAVLSRKMELLSPLEPAPVRSWSTVIVVLNNTQLQVYRAPPTATTSSAATPPSSAPTTTTSSSSSSSQFRGVRWRSASTSSNSSSTGPSSLLSSLAELPIPLLRSGSASSSSAAHHGSASASAASAANDTIDPFSCPLSPLSASSSEASLSPSSSDASSSSSTASVDFLPSALLGLPDEAVSPSRLLRSYTLQYAQIGLATDYKKKANVIRVRAEGQQFLLLCADPRECVEWTAAMQAACDLALPLDERTIPRFRSIPSRRRRRVLPSARHPSSRSSRRASEPSAAPATLAVLPPRHSSLSAAIAASVSSSTTTTPAAAAAAAAEAVVPTASEQTDAALSNASHALEGDDDDDDEDELYYRRSSTAARGTGANTHRRIHSVNDDSGDDDHDHEHDHEHDDDVVSTSVTGGVLSSSFGMSTSPSSNMLHPELSISPSSQSPFLTRARRGSVPWSFTAYDEVMSTAEEEDEKWAPPAPTPSANSRLRYAIRCLYTLPANASWGDKLLMSKGDQFIVRERVIV